MKSCLRRFDRDKSIEPFLIVKLCLHEAASLLAFQIEPRHKPN